MKEGKKYTIEEKLVQLAKETKIAKRELRKLLQLKHHSFNSLIAARIIGTRNATAHQLGIIAKYFNCSVQSLYTEDYFKSLPTLTSIKQEIKQEAKAA